MTRFKLLFINAIIVAGAVAIAILQWPVAVHAVGEGNGIVGAMLLEVLIAGIPIVIWGVAIHIGLTKLLMQPGEVDAYRAQQEIGRLPGRADAPQPPTHDLLE